jgi:hypothetical protein
MVLLPLGVALVLATFRVVATMLRGGTWHRWVHGIAFLLIIAMGLLAPLTMALAGAGQPRLAADRGRFLRGYRALRCVPVLAVGQCFIPDGDRHCLRLDPCGCRTPSDPPTMTARSKSQIASQPSLSPGRIRPDSYARTTACTRLYRSSFAKILLDHLGRIG